MTSIKKLLKDIEHQQRKTIYKNRNRDIPDRLWNKLKSKRECDECHHIFNQPLYIHHKIPVSEGGTNDEENLMVTCRECHEKLDPKHKRENDPKHKFNWWK